MLWAIALVLAAFVVPAYSGEGCQASPGGTTVCGALPPQTLYAVNGWWIVELLLVVAAVAALAFWALHVYCASGAGSAMHAAVFFIVVLAIVAVMSSFSIGPFVLPMLLLLIASAALTPEPSETGRY